MTPSLSDDEQKAIASGFEAVAIQYADDFQDWPLVALAAALIAPTVPRIQAKIERNKRDAEIKAIASASQGEVKASTPKVSAA